MPNPATIAAALAALLALSACGAAGAPEAPQTNMPAPGITITGEAQFGVTSGPPPVP